MLLFAPLGGTAYCRVTRSDSGETDLKINRILTADWSETYDHGTGTDKTITVTKLENAAYSDGPGERARSSYSSWQVNRRATNPVLNCF